MWLLIPSLDLWCLLCWQKRTSLADASQLEDFTVEGAEEEDDEEPLRSQVTTFDELERSTRLSGSSIRVPDGLEVTTMHAVREMGLSAADAMAKSGPTNMVVQYSCVAQLLAQPS